METDNNEVMAKIAELDRIKAKRKEAAKKWLVKQKENSKKQISAILTEQEYQIINDIRSIAVDKYKHPLSAGDIIGNALRTVKEGKTNADIAKDIINNLITNTVTDNIAIEPEKENLLANNIKPICKSPDSIIRALQESDSLSYEDKRNALVEAIKSLLASGNSYYKIVKIFEENGITSVRGKKLTTKQLVDLVPRQPNN